MRLWKTTRPKPVIVQSPEYLDSRVEEWKQPLSDQENSPKHEHPVAKHSKGRLKAQQILDAATRLLINGGYSALSMRTVSSACDISLGNLQYHYPTKGALWRALLRREIERFEENQKKWGANASGGDAEGVLEHAVRYLLEDQKNTGSCALYRELWALSSHDSEVADVMTDIYDLYTSKIADLVCQENPHLSVADAGHRAVIIVSLLEGASLFRSGSFIAVVREDVVQEDILGLILTIARAKGTPLGGLVL
ncbi:TetR/AcrR family transcriptional regulator [Ruegeria atlantica]|uniref:TetR/AcrR family transcriptional regulator n=1 Tax=Ruegeria atlantica TaxID=81569 RepID=UPI00147CD8C1|nr:TetR/AcrR family transcriptional regulator [Ruegeria atlantica]